MKHSIIIENTTKEDMFKRGETDARTGADLDRQNSTITIQAKKLVNDYVAGCKGKLNSLRKQLEDLLLRQKEVKQDICTEETIIAENNNVDTFKASMLFAVGCIYIMAEYYQAKQLLSELWGLDHGFEIFTLACSVGLLPIFLKAVFDRYLHRENQSPIMKRRIDVGATICCIPVLLVGLLVALLRAKVFEFQVVDISDPNIYNPLYEEYGLLMNLSFVGLALMYAICGGYLLSISMRDRFHWKKGWDAKRTKRSLSNDLEKYRQDEQALNRDIMRIEAYQRDDTRYEIFLNSVSEELKYAYIDGYHSEQGKFQDLEQKDLRIKELELIQKNTDNETSTLLPKGGVTKILNDNFSVYVRSLLINKANKLNSGGYTNE